MTLGQVLQHTAGLPDYIRSQEFIEFLTQDPTRYVSPLDPRIRQ